MAKSNAKAKTKSAKSKAKPAAKAKKGAAKKPTLKAKTKSKPTAKSKPKAAKPKAAAKAKPTKGQSSSKLVKVAKVAAGAAAVGAAAYAAKALAGSAKATKSSSSSAKASMKLENISAIFSPLDDRLIVEAIEAATRTAGGLFIPDTVEAGDRPQQAKVLAVGRGHLNKKGRLQPLDVKLGDTVIFESYVGSPLKIGSRDCVVLRESQLLGIVKS